MLQSRCDVWTCRRREEVSSKDQVKVADASGSGFGASEEVSFGGFKELQAGAAAAEAGEDAIKVSQVFKVP